jgi:hypothetical protein
MAGVDREWCTGHVATSFPEADFQRTPGLSVLGLEQFGMGDRPENSSRCTRVRTKCAEKTCVGL